VEIFQGRGGRKKRRLRLFDYGRFEKDRRDKRGVTALIQKKIGKNNQ